MRIRSFALAVFISVLLVSCASSPPPAPAASPSTSPAASATTATTTTTSTDRPDMAIVYIYRDKAFAGMALRPTVMLDGKDLVNIGNGRVYKGFFAPGKYLFQMDDKKSGANLDLKAGDTIYMRVEIVPGLWKGGGRLMLMDPKQGEYEAKQLTPVETKEIEDASHSS